LKDRLEIYIDGACSGNPGEGSIGVVVKKNGQTFKEVAKPLGPTTNNVAEYYALIFALQEALGLKAEEIKVYTDSELLYKQVTGAYKVKHDNLKFLFEQVKHLVGGFKRVDIEKIPREQNKEADKLATDLLKKQAKMVASLFPTSGEESPSSEG
jgi:ribonuclease HI